MINRSAHTIIRKKRYDVLEDPLDVFRFTKRKVLTLIKIDMVTFVKEYLERNDLFYRK
tara:strand:+ start:240 stop:413 length:174 start_codon:yes stop_codon:yes gene_type:complete